MCTLIFYQKLVLFSHAHTEKFMKFPSIFNVTFHFAQIFIQSHTDF